MTDLLIDAVFFSGPTDEINAPSFLLAIEHLAQELSYSSARWRYSHRAVLQLAQDGMLISERELRGLSKKHSVDVNTRHIASSINKLLQNPLSGIDDEDLLVSDVTLSPDLSQRCRLEKETYSASHATALYSKRPDIAIVTFSTNAPHLQVDGDVFSTTTPANNGPISEKFGLVQSPANFASALAREEFLAVKTAEAFRHLFTSFASKPMPPPNAISIGDQFFLQMMQPDVSQNPSLIETLFRNMAAIANGGPQAVAADPFRISESSPTQKTRTSDGSTGWRIHLSKNGAGWRLNFWFRPGAVEFGSVEKKNEIPTLP